VWHGLHAPSRFSVSGGFQAVYDSLILDLDGLCALWWWLWGVWCFGVGWWDFRPSKCLISGRLFPAITFPSPHNHNLSTPTLFTSHVPWFLHFSWLSVYFVSCLRLPRRQSSAMLSQSPWSYVPGFPTLCRSIVSQSWTLIFGLIIYLMLRLYYYFSDLLPASVPVLDIWYSIIRILGWSLESALEWMAQTQLMGWDWRHRASAACLRRPPPTSISTLVLSI